MRVSVRFRKNGERTPITAASAIGNTPHAHQTRNTTRSVRARSTAPARIATPTRRATPSVKVTRLVTASSAAFGVVRAIHDECWPCTWATKATPQSAAHAAPPAARPRRHSHTARSVRSPATASRPAAEQEHRRMVEAPDDHERPDDHRMTATGRSQPGLGRHRRRDAQELEERVHACLRPVPDGEPADREDARWRRHRQRRASSSTTRTARAR